MILSRRRFLQAALAAGASLAVAPAFVLAQPAKKFDYPRVPFPSQGYTTRDGALWWYAQADRDVVGGEIVRDPAGRVVGVAIAPLAKGHWGWVQVREGTRLRVRAAARQL
jgi:hypothetical protein